MKKIEVQKKNLNAFWYHIVLQSGVVVLWPKHWCEAKETKVQSPLPTYIMWNMYIHIYIYLVHMCKCIVPRWVVDR
jgi:hypothetical protein